MTTRVRVGEVEVRVEQDLTRKQLRRLLKACDSLHLAVFPPSPDNPGNPIGFAATLELDPER